MAGLKISGHFRRDNIALKSGLTYLMVYQDGWRDDPWSLSNGQHNFEIRRKFAYNIAQLRCLNMQYAQYIHVHAFAGHHDIAPLCFQYTYTKLSQTNMKETSLRKSTESALVPE